MCCSFMTEAYSFLLCAWDLHVRVECILSSLVCFLHKVCRHLSKFLSAVITNPCHLKFKWLLFVMCCMQPTKILPQSHVSKRWVVTGYSSNSNFLSRHMQLCQMNVRLLKAWQTPGPWVWMHYAHEPNTHILAISVTACLHVSSVRSSRSMSVLAPCLPLPTAVPKYLCRSTHICISTMEWCCSQPV